MRRCVALALLLLFVGQTSGAALAANATSTGSGLDLLATVINPVRSLIVNSRVYAMATGTEDRYTATHAPAPRIVKPTTQVSAVNLMRGMHPLRPRIRTGRRLEFTMPPRSALHRHRRDPLAMRRSAVSTSPGASSTAGLVEPLRSIVVSEPTRNGHSLAPHHGGLLKPALAPGTGTGVEHWWTYEERAIPGIGKAMTNVGTGNFMVSAMDIDVPEQGIDLAFQRTYNSQSLHDAQGDDGGEPAIFGNLWTNNFDANILYNPVGPTITVYDLDGAACTYTSDGDGNWIPCTGEYATLAPTDDTDCTYALTKKTGTVYWFRADVGGPPCNIQQAKQGHIVEILGRNENNTVTLNYSFNGSGTSSEDVTEIDAVHSDGQKLTMVFGVIAGKYNELATITRPDGVAEVQYSYDTSGNLLEVDKPGNDSAGTVPGRHGVPQGDAPETYAYATGTSTLVEACGPRCTVGMWNNPNSPADGTALVLTSDGALRLTSWTVDGILNFTPSDGTGAVLQPGSILYRNWYTESFVYGAKQGSTCGNTTAGTTMCDTDGHSTIWATDSSDRVTQTQEWTGTAEALWVVTSQTWDANNNLVTTTDANSQTTQYGYDLPGNISQGGNLVEMQQPELDDVSGSPSPLSTYSYDQYNNVIAYCDPFFNQTNGNSWRPVGDSLCQSASGAARFIYSSTKVPDPNEPYGCLVNMQKPGGYNTAISYPSQPGSCGGGLPTTTAGDQITQYNGTTRTPTQDFSYDANGNLQTYDRGTQSGTLDSWTLAYDPDNQLNKKTENDSVIPLTGSSFSCYYADGSLFYTETPSQHDADNSGSCPGMQALLGGTATVPTRATGYFYDLDGDQIKIVTHRGCLTSSCTTPISQTACINNGQAQPGTTCKYYDGLDRLVETAEPYDPGQFNGALSYEFYPFRWMNRYIYDLSQAGGAATLKIYDNTGTISGVVAYGNLYKTQEYLSSAKVLKNTDKPLNPGWSDVRGTSLDGLDRPNNKYELAFGTAPVTTNTYDCSGQIDLLCSTTNAASQTITYKYDAVNRVETVKFTGASPQAANRAYTYDADGRPASVNNALGTLSYTYDYDGNKLTVTEPSNEAASSFICYQYYGDGMREYLSIGPSTVTKCRDIQSNMNPGNGGISQSQLFGYLYGGDGRLLTQQITWGSNTPKFTWSYYPSGRENTETDPVNGQNVTLPENRGQATIGTKSYTYDGYGRVFQLSLPENYAQTAYSYDWDDELLSYFVGNDQRTLTLNVRGEMLADSNSQGLYGNAQGPTQSANGTLVGDGNIIVNGKDIAAPPTTVQFDTRSGHITAIPNPLWTQALGGGQASAWGYGYDAAGRQISATDYPNWPNTSSPSSEGTSAFDAENHMTSTNIVNPGAPYGSASVVWGPDGRHRVDKITTNGVETDQTAHWDGDTMLFGSDGSNPVLYIGKFGVTDPEGDMYVSDRDQTGAELTSHGNNVAGGLFPAGGWYNSLFVGSVRTVTVTDPKTTKTITIPVEEGSCGYTDPNTEVTYKCPGFAPSFGMKRADGYTMVGGIVQGARTYDPTSGQWVTPDAYAGDVHDPMSQKPFMWNNNNPVEYSDPSGYDPFEALEDHLATVADKVSDSFANIARGVGAEAARGARSDAAAGVALAGDVTQGIYRFVTNSGRSYIGKSTQMAQRLARHISRGFLPSENYGTVQVKKVTGDNRTVLNAEQKAIEENGGPKGPTDNQRNAVAPKKSQQQTP